MEKKIIKTKIFVQPQYFSSDKLYDFILKTLKEKEMTCNPIDGYIDKIYQITDIRNNELLDNGDTELIVFYEADCFKPSMGKEIRTRVEMIFPHGIFSSLYVLRFLVPFKCLENDYVYIENEGYKHIVSNRIIRVGSFIKIKITNMKYDKKHFSCIADMIQMEDDEE